MGVGKTHSVFVVKERGHLEEKGLDLEDNINLDLK
jgi:hypothetical protein